MTPKQLLERASQPKTQFSVAIKAIKEDEQVVFGEVYAPNIIDTHGDMMLPEAVVKMAHRFMALMLNDQIDVMHDNRAIKASAVESYIATDTDPVYNPGAWVLGIKIEDAAVWKGIKGGDYGGYSVEALVTKEEADVEIEVSNQVFFYSEKAEGHEHAVFAILDDFGRVVGGRTSKAADGHYHVLKYGTKTEKAGKLNHSHRYFLP